jgi:hypothetical protein
MDADLRFLQLVFAAVEAAKEKPLLERFSRLKM